MKKSFVGFLMMLGSLVAVSSYGQKPAVVTDNDPGWRKIGETSASFKMQNESIAVLGADEFSAIKIKVKDAPLVIERLQVFYESGDMEQIDVRSHVNANGESRVINLKHPDRDIQKVAFTYKTEANSRGEKADVELYGLKTNQPQGSDAYRDDAKEIKRDAERTAEDTERELDQEAEEAENNVEKTGDNIGDKISEGVNDAASAIKDQKVKDKVGPGGETAYIDDNGHYYYINNEGKKVFITKLQLRDKVDNK
jgi:hypothetical protein